MPIGAQATPDAGPCPRLAVDKKGLMVRSVGLAVGIIVVALVLGASWALALLWASTVVLAMFVERIFLRAEAGRTVHVVAASARNEGQRDAIAQVMSLELAYERSRSVLEALGEGVVVVDELGEIVLANPSARSVMEAPTREPSGRVIWEALHPALATRVHDAFDALNGADGEDRDESLPQIRYSAIPCGERVFDLTAVRATSARTGQDFGTVLLLVEVTRTHELQRIKDRFLSNVSHELRTPLTNICAYAEILCNMMPGESAEWPEFVRVIHEEGVELSDLVDGMFDFLQLESGEAVFKSDEFDGVPIVRSMVERRMERAAKREITLHLQVAADSVPRLCADRVRLEQIVRHLLDNAIKFTPDKGSVHIAVTGREEGWELRIDDDGPGVPVDERQAVFEKFSQLANQMTDKPSGTGLGLATSRAIVARFGGLIWCEDSPIGGASFVVLLPAAGQPKIAGFGAGTGAGGGF